jgi:hypothetical protein
LNVSYWSLGGRTAACVEKAPAFTRMAARTAITRGRDLDIFILSIILQTI